MNGNFCQGVLIIIIKVVTGWAVSCSKSYIEIQLPVPKNVTTFGDGAFDKVIKLWP